MLLFTMVAAFPLIRIGKPAELAQLYIDPPSITGLNIGDTFDVNVTVAGITNLAGWQVVLVYSSKVIVATAVAKGPFLGDNTIFVDAPYPAGISNDFNSTHGRVVLACAILTPGYGVNGTGTLAKVTFQAVGAGFTAIVISYEPVVELGSATKLLDPARVQIPHNPTDGFVSLIANDIAVTGIHLSKTIVNDTLVTINVTVANLGNYTASFNTTLYYDSTEIETQTVTDLPSSSSLILTFIWDTSTVSKGNYTISAYAPPIIGENYTANNQLVDGWVIETILGDLNGDGKVNIIDVTLVATAFQTRPGDPKWNPNADMDNSGLINIVDITKVAKEFGNVDP
jgi:endoglucanase